MAMVAYEQRQAWLRENGEQMMGDELMGLGLVGDDKALADLQRIAADPKEPLAAAAKRGIEERLKLRKP